MKKMCVVNNRNRRVTMISIVRQFNVGDLAMAKNFRFGSDWVTARVAAQLGPLSYLIGTSDKQL